MKVKKEDLWNYRTVSLALIPGKLMEQRILETISKCDKQEGELSSQHGFTKEKLCLINLISFCDEMAGLINERSALDVVYLNFNKAFDIVSCNILTDNLMKYRLDE